MNGEAPLAEAVAALDHGLARPALERLREVWRATRDPQLADTYELLVREWQASPLDGDDPRARDRSWRERAEQGPGDPLELWVLLAEPWTPEVDELERLRSLARWSPDPLLATTLAGWLRRPHARETLRAILSLLEQQGDPRTLARLDRLPPGLPSRDVEAARARLATTRARPLEPHLREHAATLARRAQPRREQEARTAELLAAVHAAPDHDEPRLVYADWLTAHGDPRGELIVLQIERARANEPASARERSLLARHGHTWTGVIHPVLGFGARAFERGFLASASIEVPDFQGELIDAGEWSTLRILDGHVFDRLVQHAPLDHLRELYGYLQLERFVAARADNRLGAVETYECSLGDPNLPLEVPLGLRTLVVRHALDDVLLALAESTAITGLERLCVRYGSPRSTMADHRERSSPRRRFELLRGRLPNHVRRLSLIDDRSTRASQPCCWTLTFERDELQVFSRLRLDWERPTDDRRSSPADPLAQLLETLGELGLGALRRIELGAFADPARPLVIERLRELVEAGGCELAVSEAR